MIGRGMSSKGIILVRNRRMFSSVNGVMFILVLISSSHSNVLSSWLLTVSVDCLRLE